MDRPVLRARQEELAALDRSVPLVEPAPQVKLDRLEGLEPQVPLEILVQPVHKEIQVQQGLLDPLAILEALDLRETLETLVQLDRKETQEALDRWEIPETLV